MTSQHDPSSERNYDRFIKQVTATRIIWGLHSQTQGWANSPSSGEDETDVLLFWSDQEEAASHCTEEWSAHVPTEIEFDDFIDAWLQGMDTDGVLAGPNWDADFEGLEVTAKDLADRLLMESDSD